MKTLRKMNLLTVLGLLAVALMVGMVAAPAADAGGFGHGFDHGYHTNHHYAPYYSTYGHYNSYPVYHGGYYAPTYYAPSCGVHW